MNHRANRSIAWDYVTVVLDILLIISVALTVIFNVSKSGIWVGVTALVFYFIGTDFVPSWNRIKAHRESKNIGEATQL